MLRSSNPVVLLSVSVYDALMVRAEAEFHESTVARGAVEVALRRVRGAWPPTAGGGSQEDEPLAAARLGGRRLWASAHAVDNASARTLSTVTSDPTVS